MSEKMVTVARFDDCIKADLARQWLADEGIKAFVMGQNVGNVCLGMTGVVDIELQTVESEAEEARAILQAHAQESQGFAGDEDFDEDEPDFETDQDDEQE